MEYFIVKWPFIVFSVVFLLIYVTPFFVLSKSNTGDVMYVSKVKKDTKYLFILLVILTGIFGVISYSNSMIGHIKDVFPVELKILCVYTVLLFSKIIFVNYRITKNGIGTNQYFYKWEKISDWKWDEDNICFQIKNFNLSWVVEEKEKERVNNLLKELIPEKEKN